MVEFHNPHEAAPELSAFEKPASTDNRSPDLGAGLSNFEPPPSGLHPALAKLSEFVARYPIPAIGVTFLLGIFLGRLF